MVCVYPDAVSIEIRSKVGHRPHNRKREASQVPLFCSFSQLALVIYQLTQRDGLYHQVVVTSLCKLTICHEVCFY